MNKKKKREYVFVKGGNLTNGQRFEAGQTVPFDIPKESFDALIKMKAIEPKKEELNNAGN